MPPLGSPRSELHTPAAIPTRRTVLRSAAWAAPAVAMASAAPAFASSSGSAVVTIPVDVSQLSEPSGEELVQTIVVPVIMPGASSRSAEASSEFVTLTLAGTSGQFRKEDGFNAKRAFPTGAVRDGDVLYTLAGPQGAAWQFALNCHSDSQQFELHD